MTVRTGLGLGLAVGLAIAMVASAGAEADERVLTGAEIEALLDGATAYGKNRRGGRFQVNYGDDGAMTVSVSNGFRDSGEWSLDGDLYCAQWKKIRDGNKGCWKIIQKDSRNFLFEGVDGMDDNDIVIEK